MFVAHRFGSRSSRPQRGNHRPLVGAASREGVQMSDSLTLNSPVDLLHAVPFLLGFHPHHSVVAVSLRHERHVGLTIRFDYPDEDGEAIAQRLAGHLLDDGASAALLVVYREGNFIQRPEDRLIDLVIDACAEVEIPVRDALYVSDGRWWSLICRDQCCPEEGQPIPEFESSEVAAMHVLHGAPLPAADEDQFASALAPVDSKPSNDIAQWCSRLKDQYNREIVEESEGPRARQLRQARIHVGATAMNQLFAHWIQTGRLIDDNEVIARVIVGMTDVHVRDYAMGMHDDAQLHAADELWRCLITLTPQGLVAPVATVLAAVAFERGDGALAQRALDRAFDDRPGYPMAALLRQALESGWGPESMASMRRELRPAVMEAVWAA